MFTTLVTEGLFYILLGFVVLYLARRKRPKSLPPGPTPLPGIGNLHQFGTEPWKQWVVMGEKYGRIFSVDFASYPAVVINDPKLVRECFNTNECSGRPKLRPFLERGGGKLRGVILSEGEEWVELRRFILKNLRDFGFAKKSMEVLIHDEINELVSSFRKTVGKPISTQFKFSIAALNALWILSAGERFNHDDPKLAQILKASNTAWESSGPASACFFFPTLSKLMPNLSGFNKFMELFRSTNVFVNEKYQERKKLFVPGSNQDLIDICLEKLQETTDKKSAFYGLEGEKQVIMSIADLFGAGSETTSTTLTWLFLLLALHPEVQEKLYKEIEEKVGTTRLPNLEEKKDMPYTEAVLMEVLRFAVIMPVGVMHAAMEECIIDGYVIPKDTLIISNHYAVLRSKEIWGDPDTFRPERFILPDGSVDRLNEAYLPFSVGKRICPGQSFALDQLFLFSISMLQQFRVTTDPSKPKPTTDHYHRAHVFVLKPHELIFHERH